MSTGPVRSKIFSGGPWNEHLSGICAGEVENL